jgi:hypothetical protein
MAMKFTVSETQAIREVRAEYPRMGQRTLAAHTKEESAFSWTPEYVLNRRTKASIYSAIRRYDRIQKSTKVCGARRALLTA